MFCFGGIFSWIMNECGNTTAIIEVDLIILNCIFFSCKSSGLREAYVVSFLPWKFCAFSIFFAEKLLEKNLEIYMFINQYKMFYFPAKNCHFCEIKNLNISNRKNQPISFCQRNGLMIVDL
jgi:hypothetical protein